MKRLTLNSASAGTTRRNMLNTDVTVTSRTGHGRRHADALHQLSLFIRSISTATSHRGQPQAVQGRVPAAPRLLVRGRRGSTHDGLRRLGHLLRSHPVRRRGRREAEDHASDLHDSFAPQGVAPVAGQVAWNVLTSRPTGRLLDALVAHVRATRAWLIDNEYKVPKSTQWSLGVRQVLGDFTGSVTYAAQRGTDQFTLNSRTSGSTPNGTLLQLPVRLGRARLSATSFTPRTTRRRGTTRCSSSSIGRTAVHRSTLRLGSRPRVHLRRRASSRASTSSATLRLPDMHLTIPKHPANDEKHRVVANWITDIPYLWGIQ